MSLSTNHLYFQKIFLLSYFPVYTIWYLNRIDEMQNGVYCTFASCPLQLSTCSFSPVFLYTMFPLLRKFYKEQSFFLMWRVVWEVQSLRCQEISSHLIKNSFTPNRIATVSYRLFLICLENTFSDDARWNGIQETFFSSHTLGSFSHVMKIKALSAQRIFEYLAICTCLHLYTQRYVYWLY